MATLATPVPCGREHFRTESAATIQRLQPAFASTCAVFGLFWLIIGSCGPRCATASPRCDRIHADDAAAGHEGSLANVFGSLLMNLMAILIGTVIGIAAGTLLSGSLKPLGEVIASSTTSCSPG